MSFGRTFENIFFIFLSCRCTFVKPYRLLSTFMNRYILNSWTDSHPARNQIVPKEKRRTRSQPRKVFIMTQLDWRWYFMVAFKLLPHRCRGISMCSRVLRHVRFAFFVLLFKFLLLTSCECINTRRKRSFPFTVLLWRLKQKMDV